MSIDIHLYIRALDSETMLARFVDAAIPPDLVFISAGRTEKPGSYRRAYGMEPTVDAYFDLDKTRLIEARAAVAGVIRDVLERSTADTVVLYIDTIVVKRIGDVRVCNERYRDFVPVDQAWSFVPEIPVLG